jgi:hypothetical protein
MTDRTAWVLVGPINLNVRRLMYQSLIWRVVLGNDARSLGTALDAERLEGDADALIDGMRRDVELRGDFLGGQMLVDQQQAVELTASEFRNPLSMTFVHVAMVVRPRSRIHQQSPSRLSNTLGTPESEPT